MCPIFYDYPLGNYLKVHLHNGFMILQYYRQSLINQVTTKDKLPHPYMEYSDIIGPYTTYIYN